MTIEEPMDSVVNEPEKLDLRSLDVTEERRAELLRLFPEAQTEGGKIDFERLKLALGETIDSRRERYGMVWPGKADCFKTIQTPSVATLLPNRQESVNFDTTDNLIIEGDNLEVLKLLQKSYLGKVKMIYIDPPYNTGNDFIYPDNYSESLQTYLEYTGQVDAEGKRFSTNTETDGRFHSKWLNMMYPRLYLARNLLRDDGVIFITIGDTELANLLAVCNEVFGEHNRIAIFIWEKRTNRENRRVVSSRHDYVVCYGRYIHDDASPLQMLPMDDEATARYRNPDNDPRGPWKSDPATAQSGHGTKNQFYTLVAPNGRKHDLPSGRCWAYTHDVMKKMVAEGRIWFGQDGNGVPRIKTYLNAKERGLTPETIWFASETSTNEKAKNDIKDIFAGEAVFETPKPVQLVQRMLDLGGSEGLILDFFAGSGTTAEAVLRQNAKFGGNRQFILVQLPEPVSDPASPAAALLRELSLPQTIVELTKERVRRTIKNLHDENAGKLDLNSGQSQDRGFRTFKLTESNFSTWNADALKNADTLADQLELHVDHVRRGRSQEDLLFEILLKSGYPLATKVVTLTVEGKQVFSAADGALLVCLEKELTFEAIRAIATRMPERVVCLDEAFRGNDQLKANAVQIFRSLHRRSGEGERASDVTVFRTV